MPRNRPARLVYALIVAIVLFLIGRNLYHRTLNNALVAAIRDGDVTAVRRLLVQGADPNYQFIDTTSRGFPLPPQSVLKLVISYDTEPSGIGVTSNHPICDQLVLLLLRHGVHWQDGHVLEWACHLGDIAVAKELLARGADPNAPGNAGALSRAIGYATSLNPVAPLNRPFSAAETLKIKAETARRQEVSRQLVQLLREHGAQLSLTQAQAIGDAATVQKLVANGEPSIAQEGYATLYTAADSGDVETIRQLLQRGIDPNRPPHSESLHLTSGLTAGRPLVAAVDKGHIEAVRLLLAHGADPNTFPNANESALTSAALAGNLDMVTLLLAHGAKINSDTLYSPLEAAIVKKHAVMVRFLLAHGAATATVHDLYQPPLTLALSSLPEVVPDLLKHGAPVNLPPAPIRSGRSGSTAQANVSYAAPNSPLMAAVWYAPQYEATLVRAGAKIGPDRSIICAVAAQQKRLDLLPKLLAYGADINGADPTHDPALSICVMSASTVKMLLEHGANPNVLSHGKRTPLQVAALTGNIEVVRLLLAHGAQVNAHIAHDHTALYWARQKNHPDIVVLLQQAGGQE
jgi:uncharacterized protein